jgi:hypothetical protein
MTAPRTSNSISSPSDDGHFEYDEACCPRLLVDIGAADRLASAETQNGGPMTLAGQLGMRPLVARCQFGPTVDVRVLTRMASLLE